MRKSIVVVLGGAVTALLAGCGTNNNGPAGASSGTTDVGASTTTAGTPGPTTGATTLATSGGVNPPTPPTGGGNPPPAVTGATGTTGATTGATANTGASSETLPMGTGETSATTEPGSGGETSGETTGPAGPPAGAYEACSGTPMPNVVLTEFLVSPKVALPMDMDFPPGQPNTVYVTERAGKLKRFALDENGAVTGNATTILDVMSSTANECGFFGVAFPPDFNGTTSNKFYVSYMPSCPANIFGSGGQSALDEYELNGDTATKTASLFEYDQPQGNHNGGNVAFGPDGHLYYGLGDGGYADDDADGHTPGIGNGQDVNEPLGSILRFDVKNLSTPPAGNLSPGDVDDATVDARILHFGLRNPWRFSFDKLTGDLWIGDVGQDTREEVNMLPAGSGPTNFGWPVREGKGVHPKGNFTTLTGGTTAHEPVYDYATNAGGGSTFKGSVTGGFVYRGQKIPGMYGRYIFGEYVRGTIFALTAKTATEACDVLYGDAQDDGAINNTQINKQDMSSFAEDANGELYIMGLNSGIFRLDPG